MRRLTPLVALGIALLVAIAVWRMAGRGEAEVVSPAQASLALTHNVMSPFCPGLTLAACPSPAAFELRGEIRARFDRGESRAAIFADLIKRFGAQIDGTPPATGLGIVVWTIPFVTAAVLAIAVSLATRGGVQDQSAGGDSGPVVPHLLARLEDELEELD
ncbi:MAG: hypothetical protein ABS36_18075 [Acidobacteria bacterium SCN 69-37]|nr:MAG: hypothetical protein ABS36_18075 [Acidobacteria bacterium SCN 69-37]